jgi:CRP/FNR family cyclic AMP-dependent transcriptional regulator
LSNIKTLKKNEFLFREGDPSDSCYVVKTGQIAITKAKGSSEIELAILRPGQMFGEMAFFDGRPRSASAKAHTPEASVIPLPFAALNAQFKQFPEWLKAMIKTINDHLRAANQNLKNLQKADSDSEKQFTPYKTTKLCAILALVGHKYGEKIEEGIEIPFTTLRNYTIQIFQEPTNKMFKIMEVLEGKKLLKVENIGDGQKRVVVYNLDLITSFVEFYNTWLFKEESKRTHITEKELPTLQALVYYGKTAQVQEDSGMHRVNLEQVQNDSMRDLGYVVQGTDYDTLIEKKVISEKISGEAGLFLDYKLKDLERILPYWEIIYAIEKLNR